MRKSTLNKIMKSDAEEWTVFSDKSENTIFKCGELALMFKVVSDDSFDMSYVIFEIEGNKDILFPKTDKDQDMIDEFLEFVNELIGDLVVISTD